MVRGHRADGCSAPSFCPFVVLHQKAGNTQTGRIHALSSLFFYKSPVASLPFITAKTISFGGGVGFGSLRELSFLSFRIQFHSGFHAR
ncbi:hypothetical protein LF1_12570 [Rubripirellula obstinata]|uniref:Uncharacterized protein n=1 Tax=Rubripirellula obstinata TaxID=406547 RepID=A0A5B1CHM4_9BACT|nr:hypothetical protein LF1_12570 [Rubripirellula obstinata]